jgi:hypothetical protein
MKRSDRGIVDLCLEDICPSCGAAVALFMHLTTRREYRDCRVCGFDEHSEGVASHQNVCPVCEAGVFASDEHEFEAGGLPNDEARKCAWCSRYSHEACFPEAIHSCIPEPEFCPSCAAANSDWLECEGCVKWHSPGCFPTLSPESTGLFGRLCADCFYNVDSELERSVRTLGFERILKAERDKKYFQHVANNPDLSICCTHLIRIHDDGVRADGHYKRLRQILDQRRIVAATTGYFGGTSSTKAVCFTDSALPALHSLAARFSTFGLGFPKGWLFDQGASPAMYVHSAAIKRGELDGLGGALKPFVNKFDMRDHDFHFEREWRVAGDVQFLLSDVLVVYAPIEHHAEIRNDYPDVSIVLDLNLLRLL